MDRNKIGVIGICGSGGFAISAAQADRRFKAISTVSMYDISRVKANGFKDAMTEEEWNKYLDQIGEQRWKEFEGGEVKLTPCVALEKVDENTDPISHEFYKYYSTPRGFHRNSITQFTKISDMSFMNFPLLTFIIL